MRAAMLVLVLAGVVSSRVTVSMNLVPRLKLCDESKHTETHMYIHQHTTAFVFVDIGTI